MPPGLVRILSVPYCLLILLVWSRFREAMGEHRFGRGIVLALVGLVIIAVAWFGYDLVRRPQALRIGRRCLVADQNVTIPYGWLVVLAIGFSGAAEDWPREGLEPLLITVGCYLIGSVALLSYRRPKLILTPEGVMVRRLVRTRRAGWEAVPFDAVPFDSLQPAKEFVEFALRHYAGNPGERGYGDPGRAGPAGRGVRAGSRG